MKKLVIDASVSLKWFLEDEEEVEKAKDILLRVKNGEINPLLPTLWIYEVANGLRTAVLKNRLAKEQASLRIRHLRDLEFSLTDLSSLIVKISKIAIEFNISIYDASYIALAQHHKTDFVTGDRKLFDKIHRKFSFVSWIGNY